MLSDASERVDEIEVDPIETVYDSLVEEAYHQLLDTRAKVKRP